MLGAPIRTGPLLIAAIAYPAAIAIAFQAAWALRVYGLDRWEFLAAVIGAYLVSIITPAVLTFWLGWDWGRFHGAETRRSLMWRSALIIVALWVLIALSIWMIDEKVGWIRVFLGPMEFVQSPPGIIGTMIAHVIIARFGLTVGQYRGGLTFDRRDAQTF